MDFCKICNNKLYLLEEGNKLYLRCNKCGFKKKNKKKIIITKTYNFNSSATDIVNNKYIVYDMTIPRTNIKDCPNVECISNKDKSKREAVLYPNKNTRELTYVCCICFSSWKFS